MVGGGWEPHGARLSHVLIFVIRHLCRKKVRGVPRSMGRGVWEGRWLAVVAAGWLLSLLACWMGFVRVHVSRTPRFSRLAGCCWDGWWWWFAGWMAGWLLGWLRVVVLEVGDWLVGWGWGEGGAGWLRVVVLEVREGLAGGTLARVYCASISLYDAL